MALKAFSPQIRQIVNDKDNKKKKVSACDLLLKLQSG